MIVPEDEGKVHNSTDHDATPVSLKARITPSGASIGAGFSSKTPRKLMDFVLLRKFDITALFNPERMDNLVGLAA